LLWDARLAAAERAVKLKERLLTESSVDRRLAAVAVAVAELC
jgi:hypothetical protein